MSCLFLPGKLTSKSFSDLCTFLKERKPAKRDVISEETLAVNGRNVLELMKHDRCGAHRSARLAAQPEAVSILARILLYRWTLRSAAQTENHTAADKNQHIGGSHNRAISATAAARVNQREFCSTGSKFSDVIDVCYTAPGLQWHFEQEIADDVSAVVVRSTATTSANIERCLVRVPR